MDRVKQQSLRSIARVLVVWFSEAVGLVLMIHFVPGLSVDTWETAILVVCVIALLNAILWPILSKIALPFLFFTFGIGALILNGLIVWLSSLAVPEFHVEGWALILVPIGIAAINTAVSGILTIDDDARYFRAVLVRQAKRSSKTSTTTKPGVVFLEIDGCSEYILREAMRRGVHAHARRLVEERQPQAASMGDRPLLPDGCLPSRHFARQQRQYAGVSLGREGERKQDNCVKRPL